LPLRARWPNDVGPGASRRSNAMPVVGHRTLLRPQTPRSIDDDPD
jgi:hypothetical protein